MNRDRINILWAVEEITYISQRKIILELEIILKVEKKKKKKKK